MKNLEDLAKFPSENPNPVLRVTKKKVLYINKAGELLFSVKEGDKIPELFQSKLIEALNKNILQALEVEINNNDYILDIIPIKGEGYVNIYGKQITNRKRAERIILEERNKAQNYLDLAGVMIITLDKNGNITLINKKGCEVLGYLEEELIGKQWFKTILPPRLCEPVFKDFKRLLRGELEPIEFYENPILTKNGKERIIAWHNSLLYDKEENIIGTLTSGEDITERKKNEQKLKESEAKWRAITEYSPDHILMMDKDAKILFINYTVPDLTVDEVVGKDYYDFVQEEFEESQRKNYKEVMETGTPRLFETGYVDKEGNQFYFDVHSAPIWKEGKVVGIINRSNDITDRKKKEEEIRLLSEVLTRMREGLCLVRLKDLVIVYTNPGFEEMFGYDPGELIGKNVVILNASTDKTPAETNNEIVGILKDKGEWSGEVLNIKKNGTPFWCYKNISLFDHPEFGRIGIAVHTDITERKKNELKLEESEQRLKKFMDSSIDGFVILDVKLNYIDANNVTLQLMGITKEELIGKNILDMAPNLKETGRYDIYLDVIKTGKPFSTEDVFYNRLDGSLSSYLSVRAFRVGNNLGIIFTDITDRKMAEQNLKESEEKYRLIFESANDAISIINLDGDFLEVNELYCKRLGYTKEEIMKMNIRDINVPEYSDLVTNRILEIEEKEFSIFESAHKAKDGRIIPIEVNAKNILYNNKPSILSIVRDLTERKKTEKKLAALAKFPSENPNPIIRATKETILYSNKAGMDLFNIKKGDRVPPLLQSNVEQAIGSIADVSVEIESNEKIYSFNIVSIKEEGYINIYGRDITERKKAEVEIVNLAKFPSENPNPVLRTTKEIVLYSNKAGEDLFITTTGDKVPQVLQFEVSEALDSNSNISLEIELNEKTYSINIIPIKEEHYANIYGIDITERICAEIDLKKSELTYRDAYNRAEFYKDIFTHDINNILQNISNGIQLNEMYLNKPEKSNKVKRNIEIIKRQVKRGATLVSNVRKLSKLSESETLLFNVNCVDVLKKSIIYIKNSVQNKIIKIKVQIIESNLIILANELLADVFENILTNSINYNDNEEVIIEIKVNREVRHGINYIKMQMIDNGIGITDVRKHQIFRRGYSEETSVHGMGLGLSLVKKIIESYDGEIWMENRVKGDYTKGCNCSVLIPEVVNDG